MFPILKVSYLLTNRAILEAMEGEKMVHVIDLDASEPAQWLALIQAFNSRPEGPPHLRITGVHHQKEVLDQMAHRLIEEAEKLDIPFQFNPVVSSLQCLNVEQLRVKTGEALAVSSVLQLHNLLASDVTSNNGHSLSGDSASSLPLSNSGKIDSFLNAIWGLSPKIMVVTEQDSDHNGSTVMERLLESLYTYAALFDCLETKVPRTSQDRMKVEKMLFGEEIKNIIACEGSERRERHEKLEKWSQRIDLAGFGNVPLSYYAMLQARRLLQGYGFDGYRIKEESGCAVICWQDRPLYSVSAWRCRK
ncbi:BnaA08g02160D [Brassica napus]|uniref:BnaA08g02160D protein n=2 Tax=Brassica TaxID=3705 RepID=A0A078I6N5_BRANA|nr:BnaA08g02160D [Brassica napus]